MFVTKICAVTYTILSDNPNKVSIMLNQNSLSKRFEEPKLIPLCIAAYLNIEYCFVLKLCRTKISNFEKLVSNRISVLVDKVCLAKLLPETLNANQM